MKRLMINPETGDQMVKLLEQDTGRKVVMVAIILDADEEQPEPGILSNIIPQQAEELIEWMGRELPRVRSSRVTVEGSGKVN